MAVSRRVGVSSRTAKKPVTSAGRSPARSATAVANEALSPLRDEMLSANEFAHKVFAPAWEQWEAACACVDGHDDPLSAWESCASQGLIPMRWIDHPRFKWSAETRCERCGVDVPSWPHETKCVLGREVASVKAVCAVAANAPALMRAELLVQEFVQRLAPWQGGFSPQWLCLRVDACPMEVVGGRPGDEVLASRRSHRYTPLASHEHAIEKSFRERYRLVEKRLYGTGFHTAAHSAGIDCFRAVNFPFRRHETRLNPFEPLVEIWKLGLVPEMIDENQFVLSIPDAPLGSTAPKPTTRL